MRKPFRVKDVKVDKNLKELDRDANKAKKLADEAQDAADEAKATANSHASRHCLGGADPIKLDDLATTDDNTDLNVSTSAHGLCPKLPDDSTKFLDGVGNFTVPPSYSKFTWLSSPISKTSFTIDGAWHDLDLSGDIPGTAKGVIIFAGLKVSASGNLEFRTRRNGSSASGGEGGFRHSLNRSGWCYAASQWMQGCDSSQVIEYKIHADGTLNFFYIVGYWE